MYTKAKKLYDNLTVFVYLICSPQGGLDGDNKDDLDSGDENEGRKIDTEEVKFYILKGSINLSKNDLLS